MTMRSLALFTHVLGMLALVVALAVEWAAVELLRTTDHARPSPFASSVLRKLTTFTAIAVALILASGIELAVQFGLLRSPWVGVSFAAMVLMGGLGGAALRPLIRSLGSGGDATGAWRRHASNSFLRLSLRACIGVGLGIVYVMVTKPDLFESTAIIAVGLVVGVAAGVAATRTPALNVPADQDRKAAARSIGGARWS
jgi:hypothetical protein